MKKFLKWVVGPLASIFIFVSLVSLFAPKTRNIQYGVTFSYPYAQSLGLNWRETYLAILDELHPKYVRLSAYWDATEPQKDNYDFSALDFQINEAAGRGTKIVLAVGRRLPRWPECHDPSWIAN